MAPLVCPASKDTLCRVEMEQRKLLKRPERRFHLHVRCTVENSMHARAPERRCLRGVRGDLNSHGGAGE
eukprot:CAMPEP_0181179472 /NCGR_PEP_ID=MMETSP1096-20121128/6278_1 /TAXON_ID=156174 ORGANISM="Chrysochromulina ericina, Strain CCMP281" /NCGR_SAMPLE_ID=MMETSP1096 /ASSEMBLY_ACC=CAM_ASM_000453 /LENGTH=68 /DNA_ID=CAMNT_0023267823 /DNA_START=492 /DNA_END=698 /DNA_ORIENTATION=+